MILLLHYHHPHFIINYINEKPLFNITTASQLCWTLQIKLVDKRGNQNWLPLNYLLIFINSIFNFSGVKGNSLILTPVALNTASTIAGGAGLVTTSPIDLAP